MWIWCGCPFATRSQNFYPEPLLGPRSIELGFMGAELQTVGISWVPFPVNRNMEIAPRAHAISERTSAIALLLLGGSVEGGP